ncbi:hypothetical protein D3C72_1151650 [compost metagenome]
MAVSTASFTKPSKKPFTWLTSGLASTPALFAGALFAGALLAGALLAGALLATALLAAALFTAVVPSSPLAVASGRALGSGGA